MLEYLKQQSNHTWTENGAVTLESSGSACLDFFAVAGALRCAEISEIQVLFLRAYTEDPDLAMKLLFYLRDVRGGLGERRVFRALLGWLAYCRPNSVIKNVQYIPEFGRYDDWICLLGTPSEKEMLACLREQLARDSGALARGESVSLLAKWLPSVNASCSETVKRAKVLASVLGMSEAEYRKTLTALRARIRLLENSLRKKDYSFDYAKQPSRALRKYRKAFMRRDSKRYFEFLSNVESGKASLHADQVSAYELVEPYLSVEGDEQSFMKPISPEEERFLNATWAALPDFGGHENALAVIDTSGSMYWGGRPLPAAVALSLGLYFAEHNTGCFQNCFIEFSERPQLIELKGSTFADKLRYACTFNEIGNTNLEAVFDLILNTAVKNRVPQRELPSKLIIISDMEFDCCVADASLSNFENAQKKYARHGYRLPEIVFWNVASRNRQQPVCQNEQGVILVSGATPRIFSMVASNKMSPYAFMQEVLGSARYAKISA